MAKKKDDKIVSQNVGFFQDLILRVKLVWRLLIDRRVNTFLKLLPFAALIYLVIPIDFAPEITLPVVGVLDDALVMWIGTSLFVSLCPDHVVQEHWNTLRKVVPGTWPESEPDVRSDIVEVKPRDVNEDEEKGSQ